MSTREDVILAVFAKIEAALPQAKVKRNETMPQTIGPDGYVCIMDGEQGDPTDTYLSPLTYIYEHRIAVLVASGRRGELDSAESRLDTMLSAIGAAFQVDTRLGGLCDFVMVSAPAMLAIEGTGAVNSRQAAFDVLAIYGTTDPLN